jgi:signal transduction histidine kinase
VTAGCFKLFVVVLILVLTPDLFLANSLKQFMFRAAIISTVIFFSYLLVRSILKEVLRREQITKLAQDLQDANTRLQELDRQKTEFLSIASHQLRTPLSVINGYIGLLQDGAYGKPPAEMKEIFQNMDESNTRLTKLVDEFLDITRIEQGRTKFYYAPHDVNEIVDSAVKELRDRALQKGLNLVWERDYFPHIASVDDEKIRHGIYNFIDNAIKYSESGAITVKLENRDGGLAYTVTDQGLGFDENDRLNFFQKFYRGENVQGTNVNGTGLGLYVVSKFIEAHGGKVWAKSPGLGKGSEFGFWIPLDREKRKNEV